MECGATFSKVSAADLVHCNGDLCVLCSSPFEHNLDSTVFNQQRKMKRKKTENRERKTENGKLKHKLKTKNGSQIHFCCCAATDDSWSRVGREMNDDLYVFYLGCFRLAYGREERAREREREQRNCRHGGKAKVDEEVWGRIGEAAFGLLSSVFSLQSS